MSYKIITEAEKFVIVCRGLLYLKSSNLLCNFTKKRIKTERSQIDREIFLKHKKLFSEECTVNIDGSGRFSWQEASTVA